MKKIIITFLACMGASLVFAQAEKPTPLAVYAEGILFATVACPMMLELAAQRGSADEHNMTDWQTCISEAKRDAKTHFDAAIKTVKKSTARAALKEHYVAAIATITSMAPESGEIRISYKQRQAQNKNKLVERWTRFEVEN